MGEKQGYEPKESSAKKFWKWLRSLLAGKKASFSETSDTGRVWTKRDETAYESNLTKLDKKNDTAFPDLGLMAGPRESRVQHADEATEARNLAQQIARGKSQSDIAGDGSYNDSGKN